MGSKIEWLARPGTKPETWNPMCHEHRLSLPLSWRTPRTVCVNSMSDLFHNAVPDEFVDRVFAAMALSPRHMVWCACSNFGGGCRAWTKREVV